MAFRCIGPILLKVLLRFFLSLVASPAFSPLLEKAKLKRGIVIDGYIIIFMHTQQIT